MKLLHVVGARPNFPKLAPVYAACRRVASEQVIIHTGQHYDHLLSQQLFSDLCIPEPDVNLDVGSGSHAAQTALIMQRIETVLLARRPDWVIVYGDVNSTVAASLVASKLGMPIAHVEAGLRSDDRAMPEEINRIVTDRLADLLLTPSREAGERLRREGESEEKIVFVGNVMIDTLYAQLASARQRGFRRQVVGEHAPVVVTLHRPSNVDPPARLTAIAAALEDVAREREVVFPAHPRTAARLRELSIEMKGVRLLDALPYVDMLDLMDGAHVVITDSGGVQEETTALGIPCLTLRDNTERPITVSEGTNRLVRDPAELRALVGAARRSTDARRPEGWDGNAGIRIAAALRSAHDAASLRRQARAPR